MIQTLIWLMISLQTEVSTPGGAAEREANQVQVLTFTATRTLIHIFSTCYKLFIIICRSNTRNKSDAVKIK